MKRTAVTTSLILRVLLLTGCADSPERAAKEWFNAMLNLDGNKILERTCVAQEESVQTAGLMNSTIALLPQLFGLNMESQGDVSDIKFSTTGMEGDTAYIHVYGKMRVAVLAFAQDYPVDETWIMVREDEKWKWCGIP